MRRLFMALVALAALPLAIMSGSFPQADSPDQARSKQPLSIAEAAAGATSITARIVGDIQGPIKGDVTVRGREGMIEVLRYSHEIVSPRDAASGLPTGKRQHKPLSITKPLDRSVVPLHAALTRNEDLTVELRFYRPDASGREALFFTVELKKAQVASIEDAGPNQQAQEAREHLSFTYQKIVWTWLDGGITHEDEWATPTS